MSGSMPRYSPFHKSDTTLRAADLNYSYTEEEITERTKVAANIFYFAETYCNVMQDEGIKKIDHLRKYQKKALTSFIKHKRSVWLASRQIGKTLHPFSNVEVVDLNNNGLTYKQPMFELYYEYKARQSGKLTIIERIKLFIYRLQYKIYLKFPS
jgi:hypothetical protein